MSKEQSRSTPSGSGTSLSYKLDVIVQNIALGLPMGQVEMRFITQAARMLETSPVSESKQTIAPMKLLKDLRYELSRLMAGAPVDNTRIVRLVERINEEPCCKLPEAPK